MLISPHSVAKRYRSAMHVGVDLEQFARDPYGSGIQRVLLHLFRQWPASISAGFVVPRDRGFMLLSASQAAELLEVPFVRREPDADLRQLVQAKIENFQALETDLDGLLGMFDSWLLPEVSYLPAVLQRFRLMSEWMHTAMIGFDALPMTHPENYRFKPGTGSNVSEYFLQLTKCNTVVAISDFSRSEFSDRLRRPGNLPTLVSHPGGDHLAARTKNASVNPVPKFLRVGTMEARKRPVEILSAFERALHRGLAAELMFIGGPSASDFSINDCVEDAITRGLPVQWIKNVDDSTLHEYVHNADIFLSVGIEGYGIPVLEAIRLGTPVLYAGIQPAADIMQGKGSINFCDESLLEEVFLEYTLEKIQTIEVDPFAVPLWKEFADTVAQASVKEYAF
jgi:glycosyltransferase involved in cell wall biosynthesis